MVVKGPIEAESISLNEEETTLYVGDSLNLHAYISPTNAANKKVTWSSSDTSVVTVSRGGVVKAVSCGDAEITATASNGISATCYVSVIMETPEEEYYDSGDYYYGGDYYEDDYYYDDGYYDDDSYEEYYEESYTEYVWLSATGSKYHSKPDCGKMNPNTAYQIPLEEAQARNIQPCKNCH